VGDSFPSLPTLRLSKEFARLLLDASPDRLISTACAANTGVSCSATPGCAGVAVAGDEGDRRNDPDASGHLICPYENFSNLRLCFSEQGY
jgi:hypothetical protein